MGKLFVLVLVVVGLLVAYDQYKMEQMRAQVAAISGRVHSVTAKVASNESKAPAKDLVTPLAQAQKHTEKAKALIKKHQDAQAIAELDMAIKELNSANGVSRDIVGDAAQVLGKARHNAVVVFQKAWKDISAEKPAAKKSEAK